MRLRAEALSERGSVGEACDLLRRFIDQHPTLEPLDGKVLTLYNDYARMLEGQAEYAAAAGIYTKVAALAAGQFPDDPEQATQISLAIERAAILTGSGSRKASHRSLSARAGAAKRMKPIGPQNLLRRNSC